MIKECFYFFDIMFCDGVQISGIDFLVNEKIVIVELFDWLGVDYVEGGYLGVNLVDIEFFF